jgi:hypothetical protein
MRESRFLCLAVSRRDGGNCIAGIDIDTGKWVRPVNAKNRGALWDFEIVVKDHRTHKLRLMAALDLITLHLGEAVGTNGQPENWTLNEAPGNDPHLVVRCAADDRALISHIKELADSSNCFSCLFGTPDNKVSHTTIGNASINDSLCVIRPNNLIWIRGTNFNHKPRIEAQFEFGMPGAPYRLPLTDIAWEPKLLEYTQRQPTLSASVTPGIDVTKELLLTVSLGDHFRETGYHYKLVAGVLLLPRQ